MPPGSTRPRAWYVGWPARLLPGLVPGLLMFAIALVDAGRPVLSWDEIATVDVARRTPAQIWHLIHSIDAVFGAYYFFMHFWTAAAGATEWDLRFPSIVAMSGAVALAAEYGRRFLGPIAGTVAGLFLCLMPNTSRYAAEARPYAFACFFAMLALLLLHHVLDRPGTARWFAYGCSVLLLGLAHVIALTTLAAHVVVLMLRRRAGGARRIVICWCATVGLALAALTPVFWLGVHERDAQLAWVTPLTLAGLRSFPGKVVGSVPGAWLLIGLALRAMWRPLRQVKELTVLVLAPVIAVAAASVLSAPFWVARYLLVVLTPLALLAAVGLGRTTALRLLTVFALLAFVVYPGQRSVRGVDAKNGSDYRGAAEIIKRYEQPGDGVIYRARTRTLRPGIDYYLRQDRNRPRDLLLARSAADVASLRADEYPNPAAHLAGAKRLWLLVDGHYNDPTTVRPELRPTLITDYRRTGLWHLHRATLALFVHIDAQTMP